MAISMFKMVKILEFRAFNSLKRLLNMLYVAVI